MKKTVIILSFTDEMEADFRSLFQGHTAVLLSLRYGKAIDRWTRSDQTMTAIEKEVCYTSQVPRGRDIPWQGWGRGALESVRRQRERGKLGKSLYCDFHGKDQERQMKQA